MYTKTKVNYFVGSLLVLMLALLTPGPSQGQAMFEFTPTTIATGAGARGLVVADLNGDDNLDIVSMNDGDDNISVLLGDGAGGFSAPTNFPVGDRPRSGTVIGNRLAVANRNDDTVLLLPLDGQGGFLMDQIVTLTVGNTEERDGPTAIVNADFNRDGIDDLATVEQDGDTITLFLGKGDGTFEEPSFTSLRIPGTLTEMLADPRSLALGDLNGDGNLDLVTGNADSFTFAVLLGDGAGGFPTINIIPDFSFDGNDPFVALPGDLNNDGAQDVTVTVRESGSLVVFFGDGAGNFEFNDEFTVDAGGRPEASTMVDFDGDGNLDVIVASREGAKVWVVLGDGLGGLSVVAQAAVGDTPRAVRVADLNKDGKLDIVVANNGDGTVTILLQD